MISSSLAKISGRSERRAPATLEIDVIADFICPWCYMGKRRLDQALVAVHGPRQVSWYPFQLNPEMPESGMAVEEYLRSKFGDPEALQPGMRELERVGRELGIEFRFDKLRRVPNTLNAHRVMKLAETEGADTSLLAERLMRAFFGQGRDISDPGVLAECVEPLGLVADDVHRTLQDELSRRVVLAQEAQVRKGGVTGVPDFLVNKRLFVVGAQSTAALVTVFDRVMFGEDSDLPVSETLH